MSKEMKDERQLGDCAAACLHEIIIIKTTSVFTEGDKAETLKQYPAS